MSTQQNVLVNNISNQVTNNSTEVLNRLASNVYLLTLFLFLACLGFIMFYFLSKEFRVAKTMLYMKIYTNFQTLSSLNIKALRQFKLANFLVASSFNSAHSGHQIFDYVSNEMIYANLKSGARFLEFTIFNDRYGDDAEPIVSNGYQIGEWKLMANHITFDEACQTIKDNAFDVASSINGVYNPKDPLFISLNLKTNYAIPTLNRIHKILGKHFLNKMIPSKYSYSKRNIGQIPLVDLMGKVVILSTDGYQGSRLEEFINYTWGKDHARRIHHSELETAKGLLEHNKKSLSMIYPHQEGDYTTQNYDPLMGWRQGCQFVAMNYQKVDKGMDSYISKFKNKSFVLKPDHY
jgi:hypothetical protein